MTSDFTIVTLAQQPGGNPFTMLFPMIMIMVMFYFVLIRPQRQREKRLREQVDAMKIGDRVVTAGGIHGVVSNKAKTTVTLKVAESVKLKFDRSAVAKVFPKDDPADEEEDDSSEDEKA